MSLSLAKSMATLATLQESKQQILANVQAQIATTKEIGLASGLVGYLIRWSGLC